MRTALVFLISMLAAGAAALAIVAAPTAASSPLPKTCVTTGAGTKCQLPRTIEINNPRRAVTVYATGDMPYWLGGL
jgi:hypothetical protein